MLHMLLHVDMGCGVDIMYDLIGKLAVKEDQYIGSFQPSLMWVTHQWCKGVSFPEICTLTDVFEGSIIRIMRRLEGNTSTHLLDYTPYQSCYVMHVYDV